MLMLATSEQSIEFAYNFGRLLVSFIPWVIAIFIIRKVIQVYTKKKYDKERKAQEEMMNPVRNDYPQDQGPTKFVIDSNDPTQIIQEVLTIKED